MTEHLSQFLPYLVGAIAAAAILFGARWLERSKAGQAVEAKVETFSFDQLEKGIEWLGDDGADDKIIATAVARKERRKQDLARAAAKITAALNG